MTSPVHVSAKQSRNRSLLSAIAVQYVRDIGVARAHIYSGAVGIVNKFDVKESLYECKYVLDIITQTNLRHLLLHVHTIL